MAIKQFKAVSGQSIFDVCLNCYVSLDFLIKLLSDNGMSSIDDSPVSGQVYLYDDSLSADSNIFQETTLSGILFSTDISNTGSTFYTVTQNPNSNTNPNNNPLNPGGPNKPFDMYESVGEAYYTAATDGENLIPVVDTQGNPLTGALIVSIEKEIKPLKPAEFSWNSNTSQLSLIGNTLDTGQTLFILYKKIITT